MPIKISFEVDGDQQVLRRLDRFSGNIKNMKPAFRKMHSSFLAIERKQFATQGRSSSGGWKPISPQWKRQKLDWRKSGHIHIDQHGARPVVDYRILHMTRLLRESLIKAGHPLHIKDIGEDQVFFGTRVFYAKYHQNPKDKSNRRRPVELTEMQRREWMNILQSHLVKGT
jgi:phage gpG-like protein